MGRAGGWILGLVVVVGMSVAAFVGFRSILFRKIVTVEFSSVDDWKDAPKAGIQLALEEKQFRAGRFKTQAAFLTGSLSLKPESPSLTIQRVGRYWAAMRPAGSAADVNQLFLIPHSQEIGIRSALWAQRAGIRTVFFISAANDGIPFESGFRSQASAAGIDCRSEYLYPQGRSLVDAVVASKATLVILGRSDAARLIDPLRSSGYTGRFLVINPDLTDIRPPGASEAMLEDVLMASCLPPFSSSLGAKQKTTDPNEYLAYRMSSIVLEAIEKADTDDPAMIFRELSLSPEFKADGYSSLAGGLYVVKKGALQFVEPLK